jgi:hypothetical protein
LHNEQLHNSYSSPNIIRMITSEKMRWTGHVARMAKKRSASMVSEGKGPRGRRKRRWEYNIRMYLREIGWAGMDWIHLPQDRDQWRALVNTVMGLYGP